MTNRISPGAGNFSSPSLGHGDAVQARKTPSVDQRSRQVEKPFEIERNALYGNAIFSAHRDPPPSAMQQLAQHAALHWGDTVAVLSKKPDSALTGNAIWPSSNEKDYGICVNGKKFRVADLQLAGQMFGAAGSGATAESRSTPDSASVVDVDVDVNFETAESDEAARQAFIDEVAVRWGNALSCVDVAPKDTPVRPAIWKSRTAGSFGLMLTDGKKYRARSLDHAAEILSSHGVMTAEQQRSLNFAAEVHSIWGNGDEARNEAPPGNHSTAAIRPSGSRPGDFILHVPGQRARRVHTLAQATEKFRALGVLPRAEREVAADHALFTQEVRSRCGPKVSALTQRPGPEFKGVAVWKSAKHEGQLGVLLPDGRAVRVHDLERAARKLAPFGIAARMGRGDKITIDRPGLSEVDRVALEHEHGIQINPIELDGKTIAFRFSSGSKSTESVFLSCHADARDENVKFEKPSGLTIFHVIRDNSLLRSNTVLFANRLMNGEDVVFSEPSQVYDSNKNLMTNYRLNGRINTRAAQMAELMGEMQRNPEGNSFDVVLLDRGATGIRFGDVLQALKEDSRSSFPKEIVCHFCRPKDESATVVDL